VTLVLVLHACETGGRVSKNRALQFWALHANRKSFWLQDYCQTASVYCGITVTKKSRCLLTGSNEARKHSVGEIPSWCMSRRTMHVTEPEFITVINTFRGHIEPWSGPRTRSLPYQICRTAKRKLSVCASDSWNSCRATRLAMVL
jgi:hypothetical protein